MLSTTLVQFLRNRNSLQNIENCGPDLSIGAFVNADVMSLVPARISPAGCSTNLDSDRKSKALGEG